MAESVQEALHTCSEHEHEETEMYCKTCKKPVCVKCVRSEHKEHDWDSMINVAKSLRTQTKQRKLEIQSVSKSFIYGVSEMLDFVSSRSEKEVSSNCSALEATRKRLLTYVNTEIDKMKDKCERNHEGKAQTLKTFRDKLKTNESRMDFLIQEMETGASDLTDFDLVEMHDELQQIISEMQNISEIPSDLYDEVLYTPGPSDLSNVISLLGSVELKQSTSSPVFTREFKGFDNGVEIIEVTDEEDGHILSKLLEEAKRYYERADLYPCRDEKNELVVVGYDTTIPIGEVKILHRYNGKLRIQNPRHVSDEALKALNYVSENGMKLTDWQENILQLCIREHASFLWKNHSNLTMIGGDCVKYTNGLPKHTYCVVLYCLSKGFIPLEEDLFPSALHVGGQDIEVDVREGYFMFGPSNLVGNLNSWNDPICMGSSIANEENKMGSVGVFVKLPHNNIGFITCCHVLTDCIHSPSTDKCYLDNIKPTIQPCSESFCGREEDERICGFVKRVVFKPDTVPVSVDAALVKMTTRMPNIGRFTVKEDSQITEAGYAENNPPLYNGGKMIYRISSENRNQPLIKSGSRTGLTRGGFKMNGLEVSIPKEGIFLGDTTPYHPKRVMKGQFEVISNGSFFDLGDSGSGVFLMENDGSLSCVGIAIGKTNFGVTVVTPIEDVFKALGLREKDMINFSDPLS